MQKLQLNQKQFHLMTDLLENSWKTSLQTAQVHGESTPWLTITACQLCEQPITASVHAAHQPANYNSGNNTTNKNSFSQSYRENAHFHFSTIARLCKIAVERICLEQLSGCSCPSTRQVSNSSRQEFKDGFERLLIEKLPDFTILKSTHLQNQFHTSILCRAFCSTFSSRSLLNGAKKHHALIETK